MAVTERCPYKRPTLYKADTSSISGHFLCTNGVRVIMIPLYICISEFSSKFLGWIIFLCLDIYRTLEVIKTNINVISDNSVGQLCQLCQQTWNMASWSVYLILCTVFWRECVYLVLLLYDCQCWTVSIYRVSQKKILSFKNVDKRELNWCWL